MSLKRAGSTGKAGMRQGRKPKAVMFDAEDAFELARGLILPAGRYDGWERSSTFSTMQSGRASPPRYELEFTGTRLNELGNFGARGEDLQVFDVTEQVREGMLVVLH